MKLTSFKLLIGVITSEDAENFENYHRRINEIENEYTDEFIKDSKIQNLKKPKIAEPEYKTGYYNMENYVVDSWTTDWDDKNDCPCIIATFFNKLTEEMTMLNLQYKESEWKTLLSKLGYEHD